MRTTDRVPQPRPRRGSSPAPRPAPRSVELPPPPGATGPRFPARPPAHRLHADAESSAAYVSALEEQVRKLNASVRSLEGQISTVTQRNSELEAAHQELAGYRAHSERDLTEQAATILRDAEAHAEQLAADARARSQALEEEARARSLELIEAVRAEIDTLESYAQRLREREQALDGAVTAPAPIRDDLGEDAAAAAQIRGQITDLLRLRESIVAGIRGAVAGFNRELDQLETPPLAAADEAPADGDAEASAPPAVDPETPAEWTGFTIEVEVEPVAGVLEASRIEQSLAAIGTPVDAHLRSVENGSASLSVWGLGPQELREAINDRFPGASSEWVAENRVKMRLAPAEAA